MKFSSDRTINDAVRVLIREGWRAWRGGKHIKVEHPSGKAFVTVPVTPGDRRSYLNFRADVRRARLRAQGGWVLSIFVMLPAAVTAFMLIGYTCQAIFNRTVLPWI